MKLSNGHKLSNGDKIAFEFKFNSASPKEIAVGEVVYVQDHRVSVIFLRGYQSLNEDVSLDQIVAFVDETRKAPVSQVGPFYGHFVKFK